MQTDDVHVWCDAYDAADGGCVVVLRGELDESGVSDIGNELRWAVAHAAGRIELDCAGLEVVDLHGRRLLGEAERMAAERGIRFKIHSSVPVTADPT